MGILFEVSPLCFVPVQVLSQLKIVDPDLLEVAELGRIHLQVFFYLFYLSIVVWQQVHEVSAPAVVLKQLIFGFLNQLVRSQEPGCLVCQCDRRRAPERKQLKVLFPCDWWLEVETTDLVYFPEELVILVEVRGLE